MKLDPIADESGKAPPAIHLVARKEFRLGRSRHDADYLTWFWPRSTENDERTKRLSKVHVIAHAGGDRLVFRDAGSANRSTFGGQPLHDAGDFAITEPGTLILGNEYHLEVTPFKSSVSGELSITNDRMWSGPPTLRESAVRGSVRFMPLNSDIALHNAVWILTDASFGCARSAAIVLEVPGASELEGRFHYYRRNFWVESLSPARG